MLLVLWVIRLLNGADITPRGQGVVFDCVIEFCLSPPPPLSSFRKLRGRFFCRGWPLGSRSVSSVLLGSRRSFFSFSLRSGVTMATPSEKKCASLQKRASLCRRACVSVRVLVFVPQSAAALCRAVTCSQISQRIYHPVNCLWVVDKMPPIHPHMKTLWG